MSSWSSFPRLLLPLLLFLALTSCGVGLSTRALQAERAGAYYEAERLYKELYKRTSPRQKEQRARYSRHAAEAAHHGRRYAVARSL